MKKLTLLAAAALFAALVAPEAGIAGHRLYVRIAPPAPPRHACVVRSVAPYRNAVRIEGHWSWNGHRYIWVQARWVRPRRGYVHVPGHWVHSRHGWYWVDGYWKRA